jgi:mannose-1-phosphate guanylyltransferase/mannose-6-phosphate isomerase
MQSPIFPVILCGGSGTRLWPLSRKSFPKQFSRFAGDTSLFQMSVLRARAEGFGAPVVVTGDAFRFIVTEQLAALEVDPAAILIEPSARNTAPAVLAAALSLVEAEPDALMLIAPSDHVIGDEAGFRAAVAAAADTARAGTFVTFGVAPDRPETGYGYLKLADAGAAQADTPQPLVRFEEKPSRDRAEAMLAEGGYLWNAGLFLVSAKALIAAYKTHAAELYDGVAGAVAGAERDLGFVRLAAEPWQTVPDISIDYAIMEKVERLAVMPIDVGWTDLGDWKAVWQLTRHDAAENATHGDVLAMDCSGSLLRAETPGQVLVGLGLKDIVAIAMSDTVLVAHKDAAQDVKAVVTALKETGHSQAVQLPRDYRPWGWFETLVLGDRFQVKRIVVEPGAALSLQSHMHRSEHWIVVQGSAQVTVDDEVRLVTENQSIYVPVGAVHRMENPGKIPMVLIEVQTGSYLGEDDIIRYEDRYARS